MDCCSRYSHLCGWLGQQLEEVQEELRTLERPHPLFRLVFWSVLLAIVKGRLWWHQRAVGMLVGDPRWCRLVEALDTFHIVCSVAGRCCSRQQGFGSSDHILLCPVCSEATVYHQSCTWQRAQGTYSVVTQRNKTLVNSSLRMPVSDDHVCQKEEEQSKEHRPPHNLSFLQGCQHPAPSLRCW